MIIDVGQYHQMCDEVSQLRKKQAKAERERDEAMEAVERLRKDAERYRWLRNNASTEDLFGIEFWLCDTDEEIDAAIDAAREEE